MECVNAHFRVGAWAGRRITLQYQGSSSRLKLYRHSPLEGIVSLFILLASLGNNLWLLFCYQTWGGSFIVGRLQECHCVAPAVTNSAWKCCVFSRNFRFSSSHLPTPCFRASGSNLCFNFLIFKIRKEHFRILWGYIVTVLTSYCHLQRW